MQVQVNTDDNLEGREQLTRQVRAGVQAALGRFSEQVTRIDVHLSDENSAGKSGGAADMRCLMEARLAGLQPVAASHRAPTIGAALTGASGKLKRLLDSRLGKRKDKRGRESIRAGTHST